ncbi:helix-turn-helix domain-containing protein [Bradyrhizobium sp. RDT46]|uniref:helix-turn-helix domain-containing protein n=1 Tax=Bradyrhizobium sp. RDT46 TaxID=3341829 RepID=UPI0035C66F4E
MAAAESHHTRRPMEKSLKSAEYARLITLLVATRRKAGVRQHALAKKLRKPQSFVAKYEGGERRLDVVEFIAIVEALEADPLKLLRRFMREKTTSSSKAIVAASRARQ